MTQRQETIIKLRGEGLSYAEIEKRTGYDQHNVRKTCVKLGIAYSDVEQNTPRKQLETVMQTVKERGFEYIGGYENNRSQITVKAQCGHSFLIRWLTIVDKRKTCSQCPVCNDVKREQRRREQQQLRAEKSAKPPKIFIGVQLEMKVCPVCNSITWGKRKYCCSECAKKANNKSHETRRRHTIANRPHDADISLDGVYRMDGGICYLCGCKCNYNDFIQNGDVFIAGDMYPSIDHVIPLAHGGTHTWGNVRLAHRKCNTIKRDSIPPIGA